jgi:hypothetical protein
LNVGLGDTLEVGIGKPRLIDVKFGSLVMKMKQEFEWGRHFSALHPRQPISAPTRGFRKLSF